MEGLRHVIEDDNARRKTGPVVLRVLLVVAVIAAALAVQTAYGVDYLVTMFAFPVRRYL